MLWPVLLLILLYLCFLGLSDGVKSDIVSNLNTTLSSKNINWPSPSIKSMAEKIVRVITLSVVVSNDDLKEKSQKISENLNRVYEEDNQLALNHTQPVKKSIQTDYSAMDNEVIVNEYKEKFADITLPKTIDEKFPIEAELISPNSKVIETYASKVGRLEENIKLNPIDKNFSNKAFSCQKEFTNILSSSNINFETGESEIKSDSYELLDSLVIASTICPDSGILISGHTDSTGSASFNKKLSANRANAVKEYLINQGVSEERLVSVGYGAMRPIADNLTFEGRAKNRRIEFEVIKLEDVKKISNEMDNSDKTELEEIFSVEGSEESNSDNIDFSEIPFAETIEVSKEDIDNFGQVELGANNEDSYEDKSEVISRGSRRVRAISHSVYQNIFDNLLYDGKITFVDKKATIKHESLELLDKLAQIIKECDCNVIISCHTALEGSRAFNKYLSLKRAKYVKLFLVKKGVSADKLEPVGYGSDYPIANNKKEKGREKNTRVEFYIKDFIH